MAKQGYKPSERVPVSGVYRVEHNGHRDEHDVTMLEGETFPACSVCNDKARFTLKHRANSIRQDPDFSGR
jgi:hypothetical protein